ncbi:MAG TPA: hypothetical protein VJR05_13895 [Acidimicrobiia bacterium]|nr:hypothetical protein [Acidimicrobiia bacterium]
MSDPLRQDEANQQSESGSSTGLAPWQKVIGIIGLVVLLVVVIGLFIGGGHTPPIQHGP